MDAAESGKFRRILAGIAALWLLKKARRVRMSPGRKSRSTSRTCSLSRHAVSISIAADVRRSNCSCCRARDALPAVCRGQMRVVDGDAYFNCPGARLVATLEWLKPPNSRCFDLKGVFGAECGESRQNGLKFAGPDFSGILRERPLFTPEGGINLTVLYAFARGLAWPSRLRGIRIPGP